MFKAWSMVKGDGRPNLPAFWLVSVVSPSKKKPEDRQSGSRTKDPARSMQFRAFSSGPPCSGNATSNSTVQRSREQPGHAAVTQGFASAAAHQAGNDANLSPLRPRHGSLRIRGAGSAASRRGPSRKPWSWQGMLARSGRWSARECGLPRGRQGRRRTVRACSCAYVTSLPHG